MCTYLTEIMIDTISVCFLFFFCKLYTTKIILKLFNYLRVTETCHKKIVAMICQQSQSITTDYGRHLFLLRKRFTMLKHLKLHTFRTQELSEIRRRRFDLTVMCI